MSLSIFQSVSLKKAYDKVKKKYKSFSETAQYMICKIDGVKYIHYYKNFFQ